MIIQIVVTSIAIIHTVLCWVFLFEWLRVKRDLRNQEVRHQADVRFWIEQRDRWRNLAERIAYQNTIDIHAELEGKRFN